MIEVIHGGSQKNLILFIHGFIGDEQTWIKKVEYYEEIEGKKVLTVKEKKPFIDLFLQHKEIADNFDIGIFRYYTNLLTLFPKTRRLFKLLAGTKSSRNLPIKELSQLLESQLRYSHSQYENIIFIGHSMGGLIAKRYILDEIEKTSMSKVKLYVSLATPHSGSDFATYGHLLIKNVQVKDLTPLGESIKEMNDEWIQNVQLPKRLYAQGKYDDIVPNVSSVSYDREKQEVIYCDDDHFSIINPSTPKSVIVDAVVNELTTFLNKESIKSIQLGEPFVDSGQFDEEVFVLKMLMADIHATLMGGSKQAFFNAEFAVRKLNAQGVDVKELTPLYEKIKQLYILAFGKYLSGKLPHSDALLTEVHERILTEDRNYLHSLYQPLQALQKFGMLHQLASIDKDIWWAKENNIKTFEEFNEKLKARPL